MTQQPHPPSSKRTKAAVGTAAVSAMVVVALIVGLGIGYLGSTISGSTTTKTIVSTYTVTTNLPQGTEVLQCVTTQFVVRAYESINSSTTVSGTTTSSSIIQTYQTSTSGSQSVGYVTTFTMTPTTTQTGYQTWNSTVCTVITG